MRSRARILLAAALTGMIGLAALAGGAGTVAEAAPPGAHCSTPLLDAPAHGSQAAARLAGSLAEAAARNGVTGKQLQDQLHQDSTLWLDRCGKRFYVDSDLGAASPAGPSGAASAAAAAAATVAPAATHPYDQTFRLHSRPGSAHTIYLDFVGYVVSGTAWNTANANGADFTAPGFDTDGDPATFSPGEQDVIQAVWASVAEDYAPFDVDVTTESPTADALARTSTSDTTYGTRAVITSLGGPGPSNDCGCGGIAYVGGFNAVGGATYQPAFVFYRALGSGWKGIAEAAAHEAGHTLGLSHDGITTATDGYYSGAAPWAPIMGAGYYHPVTQWSKGEYAGATNTEDDLAVIAEHGATPVADDYADGTPGAAPLIDGSPIHGVISTASDTDWFRFTSTGGGTTRIDVAPADLNPDLDVALTVYAADGASVVARSAPLTEETSATTASGLGASWTATHLPAGTYYAVVDGVGTGDPTSPGGYSDYASLGAYTITLSDVADLAVTSTGLPAAEAGTAYSARVTATGGTGPVRFSATGLPRGLAIDATTGAVTGTPTAPFTGTVVLSVTDARGVTTYARVALVVRAPVTITTTALPGATRGRAYRVPLGARGGDGHYRWAVTGTLPAGLRLSGGMLTGTVRSTAATSRVTIRATDASGHAGTRRLTLGVAASPRITTAGLPSARRGAAYAVVLHRSGGTGAFRWSRAHGALPPGVTLRSDGTLRGTPRRRGTWTFTARVTDRWGASASRTWRVTVR